MRLVPLLRKPPPRRELRDAARLAIQAALGAVLAWLALLHLPTDEYFVGILAAIFILNPSTEGTLRAARTRMLATFVGCAVGLACLLALPAGWGGYAGLAASVALLTAAAQVRPDWTYGIVAAVSLAITSGEPLWLAALDRVASIGIGAAIGIAIAFTIWPDRTRDRFDTHMTHVRAALADLVDEATEEACEDAPDRALPAAERLREAMQLAREAADVMGKGDAEAPRAHIAAAEKMFHAIHFLHRATAAPVDLGHDDGLEDAIQIFRNALAGAIHDLPRSDGSRQEGDGAVTQAQREVTRRIEAGEIADTRTATVLAFAMDEVDRALTACREAWV